MCSIQCMFGMPLPKHFFFLVMALILNATLSKNHQNPIACNLSDLFIYTSSLHLTQRSQTLTVVLGRISLQQYLLYACFVLSLLFSSARTLTVFFSWIFVIRCAQLKSCYESQEFSVKILHCTDWLQFCQNIFKKHISNKELKALFHCLLAGIQQPESYSKARGCINSCIQKRNVPRAGAD